MSPSNVNLDGVARTLLVPLACRALETIRPDALLRDLRAVELFARLGGGPDWLMGMSRLEQTFTMMRARQFDVYARDFLASHPGGAVVDVGCGLDTRFHRLDDGALTWLGLDLPEVIALRRQFLPEGERCRTIACSLLDLAWLDVVAQMDRPVIFLAEGVLVYFSEAQVRTVLTALAARFPGSELVFDALSSLSVRVHKLHPVLRKTGARIDWGLDDPHQLQSWGLQLLGKWGYFDRREPRLGLANWMRYIPALAYSNYILRYRLGAG